MWLKSASKFVFVLMALAVIMGLFTNKIDAKDFMVLASMAFAFYFTRDKGETPITQQTTTIVPPQGQDAA